MSDHVLFNLLNELGKVIECEACQALSLFRNEFNKFNYTRTLLCQLHIIKCAQTKF